MAHYLPPGAETYLVPGNPVETVKALAEAVGRGEFGLEVIQGYVSEIRRGREPRLAMTRPALLAIKEAIEAAPDVEPRKTVYRGLEQGLWEWEDVEAFEANAAALSAVRRSPPRGAYLTRNRRTRPLAPDVEGQFVPKMALSVTCHQKLSDGAKACLALILARAGKSATLVTYTSSLASQLGRTARTVRNHFRQLEEAGLIARQPGRHPNTVRITVLETCRPEPWKEPAGQKAFRLARESGDPVLAMLAETVVLASWKAHRDQFGLPDRRKEISAFNLDSIPLPGGSAAQAPVPHTTHSRLLQRRAPPGPSRAPAWPGRGRGTGPGHAPAPPGLPRRETAQ